MARNLIETLAAQAQRAAKCARPVLFEFDDDAYPYGTSGSAVLVEFREQLFAITAAHLFDNYLGGAPTADQFRIPYSIDHPVDPANAFVPHEALLRIRPVNGAKHQDWMDLAVAPIANSLVVRSLFLEEEPFRLDEAVVDLTFGTVLIRGFPAETREFDPDKRRIRYCPLSLVGQSSRGRWAPSDCIFEVAVSSKHALTSFDDLSGCPVIRVQASGPLQLAGIVLRGGNNFLHVLETRVLVATLNAYCSGEANSSVLLPNR